MSTTALNSSASTLMNGLETKKELAAIVKRLATVSGADQLPGNITNVSIDLLPSGGAKVTTTKKVVSSS